MTRDRIYLSHILECIANIQELTASGPKALQEDKHHRAALLYYLQTLAESTQKLSDPLKAEYPQIDWPAISGFRNRLAHGYLEVNMSIVRGVIENNLPDLKTVVLQMLNNLQPPLENPGDPT